MSQQPLDELVDALTRDDRPRAADIVGNTHPADLADLLEQIPQDLLDDAARCLGRSLPPQTLIDLSSDLRPDVVAAMSDQTLIAALETLESCDAARIVDDLSDDRRQKILDQIDPVQRAALDGSLSFDEESAGRLMHRDFVSAPHHWSVGQTIDHMRRVGDLPETFFEIYLIDAAFRLVGSIPVSAVLGATRQTYLSSLRRDAPVTIRPDMDQEAVAYAFRQYHLASAPVVDESGRLTGMITADNIMDVIEEESREDLLALSGVSDGGTNQSVREAVRARAPWLTVNLVTAFIASAVISLFDNTIEARVALAILMPVVVALGGNAGAQALAVAVRGLAERELTRATTRRAIRRELLAGSINGTLFGCGIALITLVWFGDPQLSAIIAAASFATIVWAALSGLLIPVALHRLGVDPAVASSVFVLAAVDVVGFLSFLGLAAIVLVT